MSTTDFEQNDGLDGLSSEELEERAFGPDPSQKRSWRRRSRRSRGRKKETTAKLEKKPATPAVVVTKFCYACGSELDARAEICPHCGVRQPEVPTRGGNATWEGGKSKGAATLLALGFGGIGAHRFYLGQTKMGLAMLLFCWTFIPALIGVVDFVRYVFMSDRRFAQLYDAAPKRKALPPSRRLLVRGRRSPSAETREDEEPALDRDR